MKKEKIIRILSFLLVVLMLHGCQRYDLDSLWGNEQMGQNVEDGMISGTRTGILRQGISGQFKSFDCTDEMSYFMLSLPDGARLYCLEHDSEEMEPLCPITGCKHEDTSCGAWFGSNGNVCVYEEMLYVNAGPRLYQMNLDGSDRMLVLNVLEHMEEPYTGFAEPKLWNGVFTYYLTWFAEEWDEETGEPTEGDIGFTGYAPYYYRLNGTMECPEKMVSQKTEGLDDSNLIAQYNEGNQFIMRTSSGSRAEGFHQLYTWDPETNRTSWVGDVSEVVRKQYDSINSAFGSTEYTGVLTTLREYESFGQGYWGTDCGYYLEREYSGFEIIDNLVCKWDYAAGKEEVLLRTGLTGAYRLSCFPDCFVLIKTDEKQGYIAEPPVMYIYDWSMERIGTCYLDYDVKILPQDVICGETNERIYLASHFVGVPEYYIEKESLKGGEAVPLKSLKYEDLNISECYQKVFAILENDREEQAAILQQMEEEMQSQ